MPSAPDTQTLTDSAASWRRLAITVLIAAFGNAGMWSVLVMQTNLGTELGHDRATASLAFAATMIGFGLGGMWMGRLADRQGIVKVLILATLLAATGHVIAGLSGNLAGILVAQAVIGFGTSANFGPLMADVSHWFRRKRAVAVCIAASGNYVSGAIWPLALTAMQPVLGWQMAYVAMGLILTCTVIPLSLLLRRKLPAGIRAEATREAGARAAQTGISPLHLKILLTIAGVACCMAMAMPQVHIVALCIDLGYGAGAGAEMLSLMLMGGVVSRITMGVLADRLGGLMMLLISSVMQTLALMLFIPFDGLASLYMVSLVFGLSQGGITPSYAVIAREYLPADQAGSSIGLFMFATLAGMALGGWLSGLIHDLTGSYFLAFMDGIAWNVVNIAIVLLILWRSGGLLHFTRRTGKAAPAA